MLNKNYPLEEQFDIKLLHNLLLTLLGIGHFWLTARKSHLFTKRIEIIPNEIEKVHAYMLSMLYDDTVLVASWITHSFDYFLDCFFLENLKGD